LISPLRYEIYGIREVIRLYREHRALARNDLARFCRLSRGTTLFKWSLGRRRFNRENDDPEVISAAYADSVRRTIGLWDAMEAGGFDRRFPIEVRVTDRLLPTETGKHLSARYILGDGSHRLAVLMELGWPVLPPEYYRVRWFRQIRPFDSTWFITAASLLPEPQYIAFLSEVYGLSARCEERQAFLDGVARHLPQRLAEVRTILRVDGFPV
jgi:hypothetical protein